jgi:hypothetical protein
MLGVIVVGVALTLSGCSGDALGYAAAGRSQTTLPDRYDHVLAGVPLQNTGDGDLELLRIIPLGVENVEIGRTAVTPVQLLDDGIRMSIGASPWLLEGTDRAAWRERETLAGFVLSPSEETDWTAVYEIRWIDDSRVGRVAGVEVVYRRSGIQFSETIDAGVCFSPTGAEDAFDVGSD